MTTNQTKHTSAYCEQFKVMSQLSKSGGYGNLHSNENDTMTASATDQAIELTELVLDEILESRNGVEIISETLGFTITTLEIHANATAFGTILGGNASNLAALQAICGAVGRNLGAEINIELKESPGGIRGRRATPAIRDQWPREEFEQRMQRLFGAIFDNGCVVRVIDGRNGRSVVEVLCGASTSLKAVELLKDKLSPLITQFGFKNGRKMFLSLLRDEILFQQASMQ
jgi:predicted RNA-binding protein YlqC (UPF0109 family)